MKKQIVALLAGAMLMVATSAMALTINGSLWEPVDFSSANNLGNGHSLLDLKPSTAATATFTVNEINFNNSSFASYNTFLNSPTWLTDPLSVKNSFISSSGYIGTFFEFKGTANFASNITVNHDDGFFMILDQNGSNKYKFDKSQNVSATSDSFSIVAGTYDFDILYSADNTFPEVLQITGMSNPVPEPGTMALLGLGMAGLAIYGKRRQKKV